MPKSSTEHTDAGHTRVYVVDDHPPIRHAVARTVDDTIDVEFCGQAASATEALSEIETLAPDVVVIDISLGEGHGLDLVRTIQERYPQIESLVYSMHDETIYAERALRAGASGYLTKTVPPDQLVSAIRRVERGEMYLSRKMQSQIFSGAGTSKPQFAIDELTDREREVFQLLGRGDSVVEITEKLDLSRKTVETYRRRAKEKLGLDSVMELLQYAVQWSHVQNGETLQPGGDGSASEADPCPQPSDASS